MGKAVAMLGVGAGGSALAVGGNYALGDPMGLTFSKKEAKAEEITPKTSVDSKDDEEDLGQQRCIEDYFPGLHLEHEKEDEAKGKTKAITTTKKIESTFFNFSNTEKDATPKSCLFVDGTKDKNGSTNKWEGDFSWLGTFTKGSKGIIWQVEGNTTERSGSSLERSGAIYFLKKEGNAGTVYKHKSLASTSTLIEKFDKSNFKNKFPSAGTAVTEKDSFGNDKDNGGFISGEGDLENIQMSLDSASIVQTGFKGHWEWQSSTENNSKKLTDWSNNSHQWIYDIYSDSTMRANTTKIFEAMKGSWIKKSMEGSQITAS